MKLLLQYLRRYKFLIFLSLLLTACYQGFVFLNPYILGNFLIDPYANKSQYFREHGLKKEYFDGIALGMLMIVGASAVGWIAKAYQEYTVNKVIKSLGADLYLDVQRHVLCMPYQEFEDQISGQILSVLQKVRSDCEVFIQRFVNVLFATFIGFSVVGVIAFQLSPLLPVVYLGGAGVLAIFTNLISKRIKYIQEDILNETTALAGSTTELLRNIELTKSLGLIQQEIHRLNEFTKKILSKELNKIKKMRSVSLVYGMIIHTLHQCIMFALLSFVFYDLMTVGQLLMMQIYYYFVFGALEELSSVIVSYREAEASLNNLHLLLSKPLERRFEHPTKIDVLKSIRFEKVYFQHQSAVNAALEDVSFEVKVGETIGIVGPSGAGKTTLVKLLVGLYSSTAGKIYYNNYSEDQININELRHQIGLVTQDSQLFSGTIKENLLFVNPNATDDMINDVLQKAACDNLLDRASMGINTIIGEGGLKISGGERQRLSIARALLRKSSLLIFDEATSSLDSLTEEGITRTIRNITSQGQYITVVIAHRLSTIMFVDRIYVLEKGTIAEIGSHDSLLKEKGLYYAMWRQQTGLLKEKLI